MPQFVTIVLLLCVALLAALPAAASPIFGSWVIDEEASADFAEAMAGKGKKKKKKKRSKEDSQGSPGKKGDKPKILPVMARQLSIEADGDHVLIRSEQEPAIGVLVNGKTSPVSYNQWGSKLQGLQQFAVWEGDTLVIETVLETGFRMIVAYFVNENGQLVQDIEAAKPNGGLTTLQRYFVTTDEPVQPNVETGPAPD